ncbi:Crp/Fnr family transcriptional regulator [Fimbriiglobus ruber]|uniref:cAMP-binding protein n=1 Tax=Fimbriiglobus ruber TaxID=1908690 RepID=A0A225DVL8_9BACT|nr:Crp/Fnr family transcriptional regulator [Fimbriiglobus ruber]OWK40345.1 cAMP-binding protein [Fimbriiglobus ruber]
MAISRPENRLLAALPADDRTRLIARMADVTLGHKDLLYRAGGPIDYVYFPRSGVLSAVVVMNDGQYVEAAAIGLEGMVGVTACLGADRSIEQVFCQVFPAECRKMPAAAFVAEVARDGAFRDIVYAYLRGTLAAAAQSTACNCLHSVDERCARWLLMCQDRFGGDDFPLTQEFLAAMLGVRRATVTVTAGALQSNGFITYRHGRVRVVDRAGLEKVACECYHAIRNAFAPAPG